MEAITVALDWTPAATHAGFFVAKQMGWYKEAGLDVSFISPHTDGYKTTPGSRLADGSATFAITPSETVISYATFPVSEARPKIKAVAALLQDSTSAIVTLASSGIGRPAQLDGKVYASYAARYEGRIVQQMIINDGGSGKYTEVTPPMLDCWGKLLAGEVDATWVFLGWEGVEAKLKGVELNAFKLEDYKIPYGYSPLLVSRDDTLASRPDAVRAFLAATARGYAHAAAQPSDAARLLLEGVAAEFAAAPLPSPLDPELVSGAQAYLASHYLQPSSGRWGAMSTAVWDAFLDWLHASGLLTTKVQSRSSGSQVSLAPGLEGGGE